MSPAPNIQDQIDHYLLSDMTEEERLSFKAHLKADPELDREVDLQRDLLKSVQLVGQQKMKTNMKQWRQEMALQKGTYKTINMSWKVAIAAAVMLSFFLITYFLVIKKNSPEELFAQYYEAYEVPTARGSGDILEADNFYKKGDYLSAVGLYEQVLQTYPADWDTRFYTAIGYIELDETEKSRTSLNLIINEGSPDFKELAPWYLALTYLKEGDTKSCRQILEKMIATGATRDPVPKAKDLVSKL
jgi:tetratricopeptide (TPR) repeat protein